MGESGRRLEKKYVMMSFIALAFYQIFSW